MAVLIEGISVVFREDVILTRYPGGLEQFSDDCPNNTLCTDGELVRVGFMEPVDTWRFVEPLGRFGIRYLVNNRAVDLVVVDQQSGLLVPCDWAEFLRSEDPLRRVGACRIKGSLSEEIHAPAGWEYDNSLSKKFKFIEYGRKSEFLDFLGHEDGVDVYRDIQTGKLRYVGRT